MVSLRFNSLARYLLPSFRSKNLRKDLVFCKGSSCRHFSSIGIQPNYCSELSDIECDQVCDDGDAKGKDSALRLALTQLAGEFGRESMLSLHRFFSSRRAPVVSTGSLKLDLALGIGGLPKGRMVEIYGKEASGKTTLALHIIKEAQKRGGYCAYLDAENAMDPSLAESMGVDTDKLLISPPDSAENLLSMVDTLTQSGSIDVIVVDSVAALVPQQEIESTSVGTYPDIQSRIMTQALRKIHSSLCQSQTLIVFLNQVRSGTSKSEKSFGLTDEVTCGGNALKFYSAIRLRMSRTGLLKTNDKVTGVGVRVQVMKNKLSLTMDKVDIKIKFGQGFCSASEVFELACGHGVITRAGNSYFIEGDVISNEHEAEQYLAENIEVLDRIGAKLRQKLLESKKPSF